MHLILLIMRNKYQSTSLISDKYSSFEVIKKTDRLLMVIYAQQLTHVIDLCFLLKINNCLSSDPNLHPSLLVRVGVLLLPFTHCSRLFDYWTKK